MENENVEKAIKAQRDYLINRSKTDAASNTYN